MAGSRTWSLADAWYDYAIAGHRFRLIDAAGSELGIASYSSATVSDGETVDLPDGTSAEVLEVYDDEHGREGDVEATLVVDVGLLLPRSPLAK